MEQRAHKKKIHKIPENHLDGVLATMPFSVSFQKQTIGNPWPKRKENFEEDKKMFAEDVSEEFSKDRRYHFYWMLFLDVLEIFAEDCFLLRSFWKFLPSGFLPFS